MDETEQNVIYTLRMLDRALAEYNLELKTFKGEDLLDLLSSLLNAYNDLKDNGSSFERALKDFDRLDKLDRKIRAQRKQEANTQQLAAAAKRMAGKT